MPQALGLAVQSGNVTEIRRLHKAGAVMMLEKGWTPVFTAAQRGNDAAIEVLCDELGFRWVFNVAALR